MASMTFSGTLIERIDRTADSTSFRFSRPPEYRFEAGQSFSITIPSPQGELQHVFSHADAPTEEWTELTTRITGSDFKCALDALPIGGKASFTGPAGRFVFRYQEPRVAFLVGGVGITPVRSMLRYLMDTGGAGRADGQELVLIYGCLTEHAIIYQRELDELSASLPGLRVVYVITEPGPDWKGRSGYVTAEILQEELGDPGEWTYYVVGPPAMIDAMDRVTGLLKVDSTRIVKENFAGYGT